MGTYITESDLAHEFGATNVATWADLNGDGDVAVIAARKTMAVSYAEARLNARLRGARYTIPLSSSGDSLPLIQRWCRVVAGAWLYQSRGLRDDTLSDKLSAILAAVEDDLNSALAGQMVLDCAASRPGPSVPVIP